MSHSTIPYERNMSVMDQTPYETGRGSVYLDHLLEGEDLNNKCSLFARVTIKPGDALHVHPHEGEAESYYILQGTGLYTDNDREYLVSAGCVTYTGDGEKHGIKNVGEDDLVFIALIING